MTFYSLNNNLFRLNISKDDIGNIDIFDYDDVKSFIYKMLKKHITKYNLKGLLFLDIYIDNYYGMIIDIKKKDNFLQKEYVEVKITFHLNNIFLYKVDYFDVIENTNIKHQKIYYYKDNYYLEIINEVSDNDYLKLIEISNINYNNNEEIIKKGTQLFI